MKGRQLHKIVILGGGTAGWMAASYFSKAFPDAMDIIVLEAPTIPRIGVGEATIPNLQTAFFDYLGIPEEKWMRECNASFKLGIRYINWRTPGKGQSDPRTFDGVTDSFYHIFGQLPNVDGVPLSHYWVDQRLSGRTGVPFDRACYREVGPMDACRAPRDADGNKLTNYAWHFDAAKVAAFLRRFAVEKQGVVHVEDEMTSVERGANGHIAALHTKGGRRLDGDLFIDCSGFRGLLINQELNEPFIDMSDMLLCNSAVATAVPTDDDRIEPFTSAIAMSNGWTWKIPMPGSFGTGYVFSDVFQSRESATREFCRMWNLDPHRQRLNQIRFRVGRNRRAWVGNCVSIGLASCFLEPLESTGIYFTYAAIHQLAKLFPDSTFDPALQDSFNSEIETMFDDTRDFLQCHYALAPRDDTEFWRANRAIRLSPDMEHKLALYRAGMPVNMPFAGSTDYYQNFDAEFRNFWTNSNYYCIFAGLGVVPDRALPALAHRHEAKVQAEKLMTQIAHGQQQLVDRLPDAATYLQMLYS